MEYLASDIQDLKMGSQNIERIRNYLKYETLVSSIHIYNLKGDLVLAEKKAEIPTYKIGQTIYENSAEFAALAVSVMAENKKSLSRLTLTPKGNVYQTYLVPLTNAEGKVIGVVSGAVFPMLTDLKYTVEGLSLGDDNVFVLASDSGHIITQSNLSEKYAATIRDHVAAAVKTSTPLATDEKALPYFVLTQKSEASGANFFLFVGKQKLLTSKGQMFNSAIIAYIVSLLTGLIAATLLSNRLSKPLRKLYQVLQLINNGDFTARTKIKGKDMLSEICQECDLLCKNIEKDRFIATLWSGRRKEK